MPIRHSASSAPASRWSTNAVRLKQSRRRPESDFEIRWTCLFANPFLHSTVAFRRACFDAAGGYDSAWRVSGDYEFWFRLLEHGRGANIQQDLLHYRENPRGLTATHLDGWHERNDPLRQRAWDRLGVPYNSGCRRPAGPRRARGADLR